MSRWKCEICGSTFENFHAQGFNNQIYCPLCYFKKLSMDYKLKIDKAIEYMKSIEMDKTDKYIAIRDYDEYSYLLSILKGEDNK